MNTCIKLCLALALCAFLSACSAMQGIGTAAGLIGGDTPSVDATAQVGAENRQEGDSVLDARRVEDRRVDGGVKDARVEVRGTSGVSNVTSKNLSDQSQEETATETGTASRDWYAEAGGAISQVTSINQIPPLFLILFGLGWLLPGPVEIFKGLGKVLLFFRDLLIGRR